MRRSPSELCRARMNFIKRNLDYVWPALGFLAVLVSFWLLYREFHGQQLGPQLFAAFRAIPLTHYALAVLATLLVLAAGVMILVTGAIVMLEGAASLPFAIAAGIAAGVVTYLLGQAQLRAPR